MAGHQEEGEQLACVVGGRVVVRAEVVVAEEAEDGEGRGLVEVGEVAGQEGVDGQRGDEVGFVAERGFGLCLGLGGW